VIDGIDELLLKNSSDIPTLYIIFFFKRKWKWIFFFNSWILTSIYNPIRLAILPNQRLVQVVRYY